MNQKKRKDIRDELQQLGAEMQEAFLALAKHAQEATLIFREFADQLEQIGSLIREDEDFMHLLEDDSDPGRSPPE